MITQRMLLKPSFTKLKTCQIKKKEVAKSIYLALNAKSKFELKQSFDHWSMIINFYKEKEAKINTIQAITALRQESNLKRAFALWK